MDISQSVKRIDRSFERNPAQNPIMGTGYNARGKQTQSVTQIRNRSFQLPQQNGDQSMSHFRDANKLVQGLGPVPPQLVQPPRLFKNAQKTIVQNTITGEITDISMPKQSTTRLGYYSPEKTRPTHSVNRSLDFAQPYMIRQRWRGEINDPITGSVMRISPQREVQSPLDTSEASKVNRSPPVRAFNPRMLQRYGMKSRKNTANRISEGNLKKRPTVPYVSQYLLNKSTTPDMNQGPQLTYQRNTDKIGVLPSMSPFKDEIPFYKGNSRAAEVYHRKPIQQ